MMSALLLWLGALPAVSAGLGPYRALVVADPAPSVASLGKIRITYLGTNGYRFDNGPYALLLDPYFSRVGLGAYLFRPPIGPNLAEIESASEFFANPEVILATHGHVDHLLDVPAIMERTRARLLASRTAVELAAAAGVTPARCVAVRPGDVRQIGPWRIRVLAAAHDRVFPIGIPFPGPRHGTGRPRRASDWVCGEPLAFLIETAGKRIYVDSGGSPAMLPPNDLGPVDLAIVGVALPDARTRFSATIRRLRPRFVLPSHQDNFFRPLDRGFGFGPMTDFPRILRDDAREKLPGRLILLDYFQPWTLP